MANNGIRGVLGWTGMFQDEPGTPAGANSAPMRAAAASTARSISPLRVPRRGQDLSQIRTFQPKGFADSAEIASVYRENIPVIVNMADMEKMDQRRLFDFMLGLKAGLEGNIKRVTEFVFLLSPNHVVVNDEDDEPVTEMAVSDDLDIRSPSTRD